MSLLKVGPWGATGGGSTWSFVGDKGGINEIEIVNGAVIDSMSFKFRDENGVLPPFKVGGAGGPKPGQKTNKISLKWPEEYLTSFNGTIKDTRGYVVIFSITFKTNKAVYGPYGTQEGRPFRHYGGVIVGFHGYAGEFVDAIGAYVNTTLPCANTTLKEPDKMAVPRGPGPWGGHGGMEWDDGVFPAIRELQLHVGDSVIHAIRVLYESKDGGEPVWSPKHGGDGGDQIKTIKLEVSKEFLVRIAGFYGPIKGSDSFQALRSITFYTNKTKHGPFGDEIGDAFTSSVAAGKVVGFHGRSGVYLDAIGAHMEYF